MTDPARHTPRDDNSPAHEGVDSSSSVPSSSHVPSSSIGDDLGLGITVPGSRLIDAEGHRKVHPISPLVHAVAVFPALAGIAFAVGIQRINTLAGKPELAPESTPSGSGELSGRGVWRDGSLIAPSQPGRSGFALSCQAVSEIGGDLWFESGN